MRTPEMRRARVLALYRRRRPLPKENPGAGHVADARDKRSEIQSGRIASEAATPVEICLHQFAEPDSAGNAPTANTRKGRVCRVPERHAGAGASRQYLDLLRRTWKG